MRQVSFAPIVSVTEIPAVDSEVKHELYYSKCELFVFRLEKKRMAIIHKMIEGLADIQRTKDSIALERTHCMKRLYSSHHRTPSLEEEIGRVGKRNK